MLRSGTSGLTIWWTHQMNEWWCVVRRLNPLDSFWIPKRSRFWCIHWDFHWDFSNWNSKSNQIYVWILVSVSNARGNFSDQHQEDHSSWMIRSPRIWIEVLTRFHCIHRAQRSLWKFAGTHRLVYNNSVCRSGHRWILEALKIAAQTDRGRARWNSKFSEFKALFWKLDAIHTLEKLDSRNTTRGGLTR